MVPCTSSFFYLSAVPAPRPELSFRYRKILYAVVTEYIATGEPVGSRKLARRYGIHLSPATIRNVLADLEEMGCLAQPHTSAGRIPTDVGFRVFVDALVQMREVTAQDKAAVLQRMRSLRPGQDDLIREAGRLLSTLTGAAAVVAPPRPEQEVLSQVRFLPLRENELVAVMITRSGAVQNRLVRLEEPLSVAELERVHNYLEALVGSRTLLELRQELAREMANEQGQYDDLRRRVKEIVDATVETAESRSDLVIEGQGLLFDRPEFTNAEKIRGYLRAFEERGKLLDILDRTLAAGGVQVLIGAETDFEDLDDVSFVSAIYGRSSGGNGALGVMGPTRMDYAKVVPLVGFTAQVVSDLLAGDDDVSQDPRDDD